MRKSLVATMVVATAFNTAGNTLDIEQSDGVVTASWPTTPGLVYQLQRLDPGELQPWSPANPNGGWIYGLGQQVSIGIHSFELASGTGNPPESPSASYSFSICSFDSQSKMLIAWGGDTGAQVLVDRSSLPADLPPVDVFTVDNDQGGHFSLTLAQFVTPWSPDYASNPDFSRDNLTGGQEETLSKLLDASSAIADQVASRSGNPAAYTLSTATGNETGVFRLVVGWADSDADGVPDWLEYELGTNPFHSDSNFDGEGDNEEDSDGDTHPDYVERKLGSDPYDDSSVPDVDYDILEIGVSNVSDEWMLVEAGSGEIIAQGQAGETTTTEYILIIPQSGEFYVTLTTPSGSAQTFSISLGSASDGSPFIYPKDAYPSPPPLIHDGFDENDDPKIYQTPLHFPFGVLEVDLDIDSDNSADFEDPSRSHYEDSVEDIEGDDTKPGKVVVVNNIPWPKPGESSDGDGVPPFADGYDRLGDFDEDDFCEGALFVPMVVSISDPGRSIQLDYDLSAPEEVVFERDGDGEWVWKPAPDGRFRVWLKDSDEERDARFVDNGGDLLNPDASYSLQDLGAESGATEVTLFLESVRRSESVADGLFELSCDFPAGQMSYADRVRVTSPEIEMWTRVWPEALWIDDDPRDLEIKSWLFSATVFDNPNNETDEGVMPIFWAPTNFRVYDPRQSLGDLQIGDSLQLPLSKPESDYFETGYVFFCDENQRSYVDSGSGFELGLELDGGGWSILTSASSDDIFEGYEVRYYDFDESDPEISYNPAPFQVGMWLGERVIELFNRKTPDEIIIQIAENVNDSFDETWDSVEAGYHPNHKGALGEEYESRMRSQLAGKKNWFTDVFIDNETREVLSIGDHPGVPHDERTQVDVLYKKGGIAVGDILPGDPDAFSIYEIKATNARRLDQMDRLRAVNSKVKVVLAKWHMKGGKAAINPRWTNKLVAIGLVAGIGGSIYAVLNYTDHEDLWEDCEELIETVARNSAQGNEREVLQFSHMLATKLMNYYEAIGVNELRVDIVGMRGMVLGAAARWVEGEESDDE